MPNYQAIERNRSGRPQRLPQRTGQPPEYDFRVSEVRAAPVIALALSDVMDADRLLADGTDIGFVDGGPKANLTFTLKTTGIAPATYGAALKIPIITFDAKGRATLASETSLGTAALLDSDNDPTLGANSATRLPTQQAIRSFVSQAVAGLLEYKGDLSCAANPNYPVAEKGDSYVVTAAGRIGGASGKLVDIGDFIIARADNAGGTEAAVGASWFVLEHNLAGALLSANNLSDVANVATARTNLGLGTAATQNTGTSGAAVPLLNGGNIWSANQQLSRIGAAASADYIIASDAGQHARVRYRTGSLDRWTAGKDNSAGENFAITRYNDAGAAIDVPLSINRATGVVSVASPSISGTGGNLYSGTYTPTLTNTTNVGGSTAYPAQYSRVGNVVTVTGKVDIQPSASGAATVLGISLPIASNLANEHECCGTAAAPFVAGQSAGIRGSAASDIAEMVFISQTNTNQGMFYSFQYQLL